MARTQRFPFPEDKIVTAVRDYRDGMSILDVAQKYGSTRSTTWRVLQEHTDIRPTVAHDDATVRAMLTAYRAGATYREIAGQFGGTDISVRNALIRRGGLVPRTTAETKALRRDVQNIDVDELLRLRREGCDIQDLARRYKVRNQRITEVLRERGVIVRSKGAVHEKFDTAVKCDALVQDYREVASLKVLAQMHDVTVPTIVNALDRAGCDFLDPGRPTVWTDEMIEKGRVLSDTGGTPDEIAVELGVSYGSVRRNIVGLTRDGQVISLAEQPASGYIYVSTTTEDRRFCTPGMNGQIGLHRLVMGRHLGRPVTPDETVHHVNGRRDDNRIENLQLRSGAHGAGQARVCGDCGSSNVVSVPLAGLVS